MSPGRVRTSSTRARTTQHEWRGAGGQFALRTAELIATQSAIYPLKTPYRGDTTHFVFAPLDFLARLAALVPRPRGNLVRYHGILAPNARHRSRVVPATPGRRRRSQAQARAQALGRAQPERDHQPPTAPMTADCMAISIPFAVRTGAIDLSACPHCGGRLRVIAGADFRT